VTVYAVPHASDPDFQVQFESDRVRFTSSKRSTNVRLEGDTIYLDHLETTATVNHDVVGEVCSVTGLDRGTADPLIRRFLELSAGVPYATAIESWMIRAHPLLGDLAERCVLSAAVTTLPRRLEVALRKKTLREAAATYWQEDTCGPAAARTFSQCLTIGSELSEVKISWLGLVTSNLRPELVNAPTVSNPNAFAVTPECRSVFELLRARTAVDVVKFCLPDPTMPMTVLAGHQLGYKMTGRDPARIIGDLKEFVRSRGFGRCRDLGEFLTKRGIAGNKVTELLSSHDLVVASSVLQNCLNNPSQPYRHGVLSGKYKVFCVGDDWSLGAVAFESSTWRLIEAKGFRNAELAVGLRDDLSLAISEWEQGHAEP
jgi:hypothetical protein